MKKVHKKIISTLMLIPFFSVITFCCCLEKDADASIGNVSTEHHQALGNSNHHSEHQHQHSKDQGECFCPKHFSFLSQQAFDTTPNLSSFQLLVKNFLAVLSFEVVLLSTSSFHSQGPPWKDYHDQVSIPIFLKNFNLRI